MKRNCVQSQVEINSGLLLTTRFERFSFISIFYRELSTEKWNGHFLTGVNLVELVLIKFTDLGPGLGLGLLHTVRSVQYDVREAQTGVPPRGDLHLCSEGHPEVGALSSQLSRTELHEVNAMGDS